MTEKDTLARQRLIELEKKHAKAVRKLQRAEKNKQRRQTFHGFTVKDENTNSKESQHSPSMLLSQVPTSADVRKSGCLSAHKRGFCKTVTFKESVDTDEQLVSENKRKSSGQFGSNNASRRTSAPVGSRIPQNESECDKKVLHYNIDSNDNSFRAADDNMVRPSGSLNLSDNEKILSGNVVCTEKKDCFRIQPDKDQARNNGLCNSEQHVSKVSSCSNKCSDLVQEICLINSENEFTALPNNVINPSEEAVCNNRNSSDDNSQDKNTRESLCLSKDKSTLNEKVGLDKKDGTSNPTSVNENDYSPSENCHWLWLFKEDFPRRSPRIRSTPNFRRHEPVVSQDNNVKQPRKTKTKPTRTKQARTRKEMTPSRGDNAVKSKSQDTSLHGSLPKESLISSDFVFPRPSLEQTKHRGPLAVVVDFSLPDKEFAKLKLAKIRGTLSAERANKELNDNLAEMALEVNVSEMEGDSCSTLTNKEATINMEKTIEVHVREMEEDSKFSDSKRTIKDVNDKSQEATEQSVSDKRGNSKLSNSKCEQETKEENSVPLSLSSSSPRSFSAHAQLVSELKSKDMGIFSSANTLEANVTEKVKEHYSTVTLECNKQSEYAGGNSSFKLENKLDDLQLQNMVAKSAEACNSPKQQSQKVAGIKTCMICQLESSHCNCGNFETVSASGTSSIHDVLQTDDIPDYYERCPSSSEYNRLDNQGDFDKRNGLADKNALPQNSNAGIEKEIEFSTRRDSNNETSKTAVLHENCCSVVSCDSAAIGFSKIAEHQNVQGELFNLTQDKSSPPTCGHEPSFGDQATPYGKMNEPLESSQLPCVMSPVECLELSPVLMMACLQHHIEGKDNKVQSVSLSSYEPSTEKDVSLPQDKRDLLAVCLSHLVVIWTVVPGLQWTVLYKWTLPLDGEEEFVSAQFVPLKSHVVLLVGGNFRHGNGRILGYSEEGDYSLNLEHSDERNKHFFSTMCLLHNTVEHKIDEDVEFVIGDNTSHEITLTKWTLDSFCLLVERWQTFTPICSDTELTSLQPVHGSHCLLLGTAVDKLFLWNHITCQQLRCINLHATGLGHLSCLKAFTERGLLFLMMSSNSSAKGRNCGDTKPADACSLYALNPKTSKMICLECFCLPERVTFVGTNGQYIAAGRQGRGEVNMWNLNNSHRHATLQVFQDEVSSIGFHQDMPLMAFGSVTGCVHLFSLC